MYCCNANALRGSILSVVIFVVLISLLARTFHSSLTHNAGETTATDQDEPFSQDRSGAHSKSDFAFPWTSPKSKLSASRSIIAVSSNLQDTTAFQASEMVRTAFNLQRSAKTCANLPTLNQSGTIQYSVISTDIDGNVTYSMEIDFGEGAVHAQIAIPSDKKLYLLSSVPGPCEFNTEDYPAVTYEGER